MWLWQLSGLALSGAGIFALYLAWRCKQRSWPLIGGGWALLLVSVLSWGQTSGVDKGPALGLVSITLTAMLAICIVAMRTPVKHRRGPRARIVPAEVPARARNSGWSTLVHILAIAILGLCVSVAACTALFMGSRSLGMEHTANLSLTMFAFPLVWAVLATYIGYSASFRGRAGILLSALALSTVIIFSTMQVN